MNKKELEAKLEQAKYDTEQNVKAVQTAGANEVERIEALIEATKPKLRYGDYGLGDNEPVILHRNRGGGSSAPLLAYSMSGTHCGTCSNAGSITRKLTILGNLDDDIKALREKVTEFECGDIKISFGDSGYLYIEDTDDMESVQIPEKYVDAAIMAIRQMQATHKNPVV